MWLPGHLSPQGRDEAIDPVRLSLLLSRFEGIASEMTLTLESSAWTSILGLVRDYSCAIYGPEGQQDCMFDARPIYTMSMHLVLAEIDRTVRGRVSGGDVFFATIRIAATLTSATSSWPRRCLSMVSMLSGRWPQGVTSDIGAIVPSSVAASARNIWQEGRQTPPVKIFGRGVERTDVIDFVLASPLQRYVAATGDRRPATGDRRPRLKRWRMGCT